MDAVHPDQLPLPAYCTGPSRAAAGGGRARSNAPAENVLCISGPQSTAEFVALFEQLKGSAENGSVRMVFLNSQQDVSNQLGPRAKVSRLLDVGLQICMAENHSAFVMLPSTPIGQVGE